jgi:hypothetical protein
MLISANPCRSFSMRTRLLFLAAIALPLNLLLVAAAHAQLQTQMQPGLWETTMQMKSQSGEMEKAMAQAQAAMAKMTPEQRKQMEAMMGKNGMAMGGTPNTVRICISPEQAAMRQIPARDGCTHTMQHSGNTTRMQFSCAGNPPSTGEGQFTLQSPKAYDGEFTFTTQRNGKPEVMQMKQAGKWLSADCGAIKTIAMPPANKTK